MSRKLLVALSLLASLTMSFNASACDDKSCEVAYLIETEQHVANQIRRAESSKLERHAYSKNRERRAYAMYVHYHMMQNDNFTQNI